MFIQFVRCLTLSQPRPEEPDCLPVKTLLYVLRNCQLAFLTAEVGLGITPLLDVADVARGCPDRLSILTYVSQFYHTFQAGSTDSGISSPSEEQDRTRLVMREREEEMVDVDV